MAPSRFGVTTSGNAPSAAIKSPESKFSPKGLNKPPAPSTSNTSKRFCSARTCPSAPERWTCFRSRRAANSGAIGARKCHGLISSSDSALFIAARSARASARPPEQTGFSAAAFTPRPRRNCTSSAVKTVLPTPVSVPVIKIVRFTCQHQSGKGLRAPSKPFDGTGAVQLSCAARLTDIYCEHHR